MNAREAEQKLRDAIRRRHLAWSTEQSYVTWLRRYEEYLRVKRPEGDSTAKVTGFLTDLAHEDLSASSQNQALQALLMFYREAMGVELGRVDALRAKRPEHIRYAPSREEMQALLRAVADVGGYPTRLIAHMLYGCGMRVNEPLNLRLKDVDLANSTLAVRGGKGFKDRIVPVPCSLAEPIRRQAAIAAVFGFGAGITLAGLIVRGARDGSAAILMPWQLAAGLGLATFLMCAGAAVISIRRVMAIDPVSVFK
jgi:site-specific recombinase XerD